MINFIVATAMLTLCLLITTHSLFYAHIQPYECKSVKLLVDVKILARNFGVRRAKASIGIAKFMNAISCGIWTIEGKVPLLSARNKSIMMGTLQSTRCYKSHQQQKG